MDWYFKLFFRHRIQLRSDVATLKDTSCFVITAPLIACSLSHDSSINLAPILTKKGYGISAKEIIKAAKDNNLPIVEYQTLARLLFLTQNKGYAIDTWLYCDVIKVLSVIYHSKKLASKVAKS